MASCVMRKGCDRDVTHLGEQGYTYCATHAPMRRGYERVRKLRAWELRWLSEGRPLPSYRLAPEPQSV